MRFTIPFLGQRTRLSREQAVERYILLRLRTEEINRLGYLVEGFYANTITLPKDAPYTPSDLKDTARTAFFGWFATLTDKNGKAVYAFDPLLVLFPHKRAQILKVQLECEACHAALQQFRGNVAFHTRSSFSAYVDSRKVLQDQDTFLDLESARIDFQRLMSDLVAEEVTAIPELPKTLKGLGAAQHPAFANVPRS